MKLIFSPCPNDIYMFYGLINKKISYDFTLEAEILPIHQLNELVLGNKVTLAKVSFQTAIQKTEDYEILPVGAAFGINYGPKLVSKTKYVLENLNTETILSPGKTTTAHALVNYLLPKSMKLEISSFNEIEQELEKFPKKLGVIIHESRLSLEEKNLYEICDLGKLWFLKTKLPLPLGCLVYRKKDGTELRDKIIKAVQESLHFAKSNESEVMKSVLDQSVEKDSLICQKHIELYVNHLTYEIGVEGKRGMDFFSETLTGNCGAGFIKKTQLVLEKME